MACYLIIVLGVLLGTKYVSAYAVVTMTVVVSGTFFYEALRLGVFLRSVLKDQVV